MIKRGLVREPMEKRRHPSVLDDDVSMLLRWSRCPSSRVAGPAPTIPT